LKLINSWCETLISDVKGGCLYGGNLSRTPPTPKFRGVQVFTYRELEVATNGFNEANEISNGGINGLMYKGVLSDGTLAAIKLLHSEGKQGERAFRIEVSEILLIHLFLFLVRNDLTSLVCYLLSLNISFSC